MSNKTIIKHPIHTFQTYIARERASYTPRKELGRSATASLPTLSGRCKRPFARDMYLYSTPTYFSNISQCNRKHYILMYSGGA